MSSVRSCCISRNHHSMRCIGNPWATVWGLIPCCLLVLISLPCVQLKPHFPDLDHAAYQAAAHHFDANGARAPSKEFLNALHEVAVDISIHHRQLAGRSVPNQPQSATAKLRLDKSVQTARLQQSSTQHAQQTGESSSSSSSSRASGGAQEKSSGRRKLVLLTMANQLAVDMTLPLFLHSLSLVKLHSTLVVQQQQQITNQTTPISKERSSYLDAHLVVVCSSAAATAACRLLPYNHHCVHDTDYNPSTKFPEPPAESKPLNIGRPASKFPNLLRSSRALASSGEARLAEPRQLLENSSRLQNFSASVQVLSLDPDRVELARSMSFHKAGFNSIGFAKIKYLVNTISTGYDIIFLDADIIMLQDVVSHTIALGADIAVTVEKCVVVDESLQYQRTLHRFAPNIGVLYLRSTDLVILCIKSWMAQMAKEVYNRPLVWDQDIFLKIVPACAKDNDVPLHVFSPRTFNNACFHRCGCTYKNDSQVGYEGVQVPFSDEVHETCKAKQWESWVLMHFPCSGDVLSKSGHMARLLDAVTHDYAEAHISDTKG